ncbi:uncharacterized protein LOC106169173 [Lingula anatina]|uniref:Uncharacterized protein LOC106169173 n=1 Tax=Lingula anatina TaxID=7574 RepID=A0A1S3J172_LINAN|nr:uncharacterized protein LOC106169173 [Lingula anatina]|eukprot:XP_013404008.1 uncharacterized protein LOC106169173 [Lingula anatina]
MSLLPDQSTGENSNLSSISASRQSESGSSTAGGFDANTLDSSNLCAVCGKVADENRRVITAEYWREIRQLFPGKENTEISSRQSLICTECHVACCRKREKDRHSPMVVDGEDGDKVKHLRMLAFVNPGKFMEDFDPEKSAREMRKMNRRIYRDNFKKNQLYDDTGRYIDDSSDLCDCLDVECPGCHFPCAKCGSEKCGADCRCNRKWVYEQVEIEGAGLAFRFQQGFPT